MPYINIQRGQQVTVTIVGTVADIDARHICIDGGIAIPQDHPGVSVTVDDEVLPEYWPVVPGDVWRLHEQDMDDTSVTHASKWMAHDMPSGLLLSDASDAASGWRTPNELRELGRAELAYRDGVTPVPGLRPTCPNPHALFHLTGDGRLRCTCCPAEGGAP